MGMFKDISLMCSGGIQCFSRHMAEFAQRSLVASKVESKRFYNEECGGIEEIEDALAVCDEVKELLLGNKKPQRKNKQVVQPQQQPQQSQSGG